MLVRNALVTDQRGAVFVEFIISFIPMFIFFLGITQLAFSYGTKIVVQYAADKAVRAAIITEPKPKRDCKDGSGDQGGDSSSGDSSSGDSSSGASAGLQDPFSMSPSPHGEGKGEPSNSDNPLINKVRAAAYLPLSTVAPPVAAYPLLNGALGSIGNGLGQYTKRFAAGYFIYNRSHAGVTFRDAEGKVYEPTQLEKGPVTVHVSYLHYCMIPLVSRFMCNPLYDLGGIGREVAGLTGALGGLKNLNFQETIDSKGANITQAVDRLEVASDRVQKSIETTKHVYGEVLNAEYPALLLAWAEPKHRFQLIESEATLPFQYASYVYKCQDAK